MRQKIIGAGIAVVLVSLAAVGAFASQDNSINLLAETPVATDTPTATNTPGGPTDTPSPTDTPAAATETPTATNTPGGPTDTPTATDTPAAATDTPTPTDTPSADTATPTDTPTADTPTPTGEDADVHGIPDSNPSHHPEDGDGECEPGETVIKTTPSGNEVNVPCQTQKHQNHGHHNDD